MLSLPTAPHSTCCICREHEILVINITYLSRPCFMAEQAFLVLQLCSEGQLHPLTIRLANLVPQLLFLGQTHPCADTMLHFSMRLMWKVHFTLSSFPSMWLDWLGNAGDKLEHNSRHLHVACWLELRRETYMSMFCIYCILAFAEKGKRKLIDSCEAHIVEKGAGSCCISSSLARWCYCGRNG